MFDYSYLSVPHGPILGPIPCFRQLSYISCQNATYLISDDPLLVPSSNKFLSAQNSELPGHGDNLVKWCCENGLTATARNIKRANIKLAT